MATVIYGLVPDYTTLDQTITALEHQGFSHEDISVVMPEEAKHHTLTHERHSKAPEGAVAGGAFGGVAGGITGLLAGIGVLAVPGLGPLVAAGPLLAALSGFAVGGMAGGLAGSLVGLGIPELEAKHYAERISGNHILIAIHTAGGETATRAASIMREHGVEEISTAKDDSDAD